MTPRAFLLGILQAFGSPVPVKTLIRAADLFDFDENRVRVALHRLRAKGLVVSEERGSYEVGPAARAVAKQVGGWRRQLDRLVPWQGAWMGAHTAHLPRADKTTARRRDRALSLLGFRELESGLAVRPDNLLGSVDDARERLVALGLETEAPVFRLDDLGRHNEPARALWHADGLDDRYRSHTRRLTEATLQLRSMTTRDGARMAFEVGDDAVRDIAADPLLPAPIVDPALRQRFLQTMLAFDDVSRGLWSEVLETNLLLQSPTLEPTLT